MKFCVAMYDWPRETDSIQLAALSRKFMIGRGMRFLTCVVTDSVRDRTTKVIDSKLDDILNKRSPAPISSTLEVFFGSAAPVVDFARDWVGYLSVEFSSSDSKKTLICCWPEIGDKSEVDKFLASLSTVGKLCYGIGFFWSRDSDPTYHASGITHGFPGTEADNLEADNDQRWFEERVPTAGLVAKMRHREGMFRDIYEVNILGAEHLSNQIGRKRLLELIQHDKGWGSLIALENENWLWRVPRQCIPGIRFRLEQAGCLLIAT